MACGGVDGGIECGVEGGVGIGRDGERGLEVHRLQAGMDGLGDLLGRAVDPAQAADVEDDGVARGLLDQRREVAGAVHQQGGVSRGVETGEHND
jgi:hypothetical protein